MIAERAASILFGLIQEAFEHLNHCFNKLLLFFIVHLLVARNNFQLIDTLLAELFLYLLNLIRLKTSQVMIERSNEVNYLSRQIQVLLVALLQDLPHHLDSFQLAWDGGHIELHFDCAVYTGGFRKDLQELSVLIHLQEHVLDTVKPRLCDR